MEIYNDIPESKDPGLQRTLEDPGPLRTQDPRGPRNLDRRPISFETHFKVKC